MFLRGQINFSICIVHDDCALETPLLTWLMPQQKSEYNGDASVDHGDGIFPSSRLDFRLHVHFEHMQ